MQSGGAVSKKINESKGYEGGFWWGFWLGIIGLIVVAVKPEKIRTEADGADTLLKLKSLLDTGVITQEEFDKKKKELLKL